jgi:DNA-binding NarL/FixJ family response regulator
MTGIHYHPPTVREQQILDMLNAGLQPDRVVQIGSYRRAWSPEDVRRVVYRQGAGGRDPWVRWMPSPPPIPGDGPPEPLEVELTLNQSMVLDGMCRGLSNEEIAAERQRPVDTIKSQIRVILAVLRVADRTQAAAVVWSGAVRVYVPNQYRRTD